MGSDINIYFPYRVKSFDWTSELVFCLWPRICFYSGKRIWFKKAYKGTAWFVVDTQLFWAPVYADKNQFIIHQLSK